MQCVKSQQLSLMGTDRLSYSIASTLWEALSPLFPRLCLAGPTRFGHILVGWPRSADSVLLSLPVRKVKAILQASLIFFPDIFPQFSFLLSLSYHLPTLSSMFPSPSLFSSSFTPFSSPSFFVQFLQEQLSSRTYPHPRRGLASYH